MCGAILGPRKQVPLDLLPYIPHSNNIYWQRLVDLNRKWLQGSTTAAMNYRLQFVLWPLFQIMTGNSVLKDGRAVVEVYGIDLDKLTEGDRIGVMRTAQVMDFNWLVVRSSSVWVLLLDSYVTSVILLSTWRCFKAE
jgi:hypothetical protein